MLKEEFAQRLTGREIGNEITNGEAYEAKLSGLLVVFGASDDLCEFRGAVYDEGSVYDCGDFYVSLSPGEEKLLPMPDGEQLETLANLGLSDNWRDMIAKSLKITAQWNDGLDGPCWTYKTNFPHATFDIMEDGEVWCRGIVIDLKDKPCQD